MNKRTTSQDIEGEPVADRDEEKVRRRVAETYGRLVGADAGCCDPQSQECASPDDAAATSFGCGSPARIADIGPGDVVLDLGCGAGLDLLLAADKVGPTGRVIGVEMTDEMIEAARANITAAASGNIEVRKGIIEDLPVVDDSVDWVISNCVINLSPNKARVFAEIARVLRPGGRMRVADIVVEDLPQWVRNHERLYDSCIAGAICEAEYVAGLRTAGLTDLTLGGRYVYDRDQLAAITVAAGGSQSDAAVAADALVGQVWSVYISAAKPVPEEQGEDAGGAARTCYCPTTTEPDRDETRKEGSS